MNHQQRAAARMLLNVSALAGHPHILQCVEADGWRIDWERLNEWNWSGGEKVLLELLRVCILGHGDVKVADIYKLDTENQCAAANAINTLFSPVLDGQEWAE